MRSPWNLDALVYAGLAVVAAAVSEWLHGSALHYPHPMLALSPITREVSSCGVGLGFAVVVILLTRVAVARASWAGELHRTLRPVTVGMTTATVLLLAALSGVAEEFLFRSLLCPLLGIVPQALLFGAAHQGKGSARWTWMIWATVVGLALGMLYQGLGSITGPIVAHATINAINLIYLRDHVPVTS